MIFVGYIFAGFVLLFLGGELVVRSAVSLARRLKMSTLLIGITVVAYGTSAPELLITIQALQNGANDIAFGNVVGSNIANIFLVLGLVSVIYPIKMKSKLIKFDMCFLVVATFLLMLFISDHSLSFAEAGFFIVTLIIYTYLTFKQGALEKKGDVLEDQVQEVRDQIPIKNNIIIVLAMFVASVFALAFGAKFLVYGASEIARIYSISEATIAVTIVAVGGSAPEIVTSLVSAFRRHSDIAIGNVIGSNIFNILGVLGIGGLLKPFAVSSTLVLFDIWVVFIATLLLFIISAFKKTISRIRGGLFLGLYSLYIIWQILV